MLEYNAFLGPSISVRWETPIDVSDVGQIWALDRSTIATDGYPWWNRLNHLLTNGVYDSNFTFHMGNAHSTGGYGLPGDLWTDGDDFAYTIDSSFTPANVDMQGHHLTRLTIRLDELTTSAPYETQVTITLYGEPGQVPEPSALLPFCSAALLLCLFCPVIVVTILPTRCESD